MSTFVKPKMLSGELLRLRQSIRRASVKVASRPRICIRIRSNAIGQGASVSTAGRTAT